MKRGKMLSAISCRLSVSSCQQSKIHRPRCPVILSEAKNLLFDGAIRARGVGRDRRNVTPKAGSSLFSE